jgi:NAD(P)-dependent dehydrogenase (short-subunit alcohol dehydrogenase family)
MPLAPSERSESKGALAGARVLVTGGSRGLGRALCERFAAEGARVAFTWSRDEEAARATLDALRGAGAEARAWRVSVVDGDGTRAMVKELEAEWGGLTALVNNAAITQVLPLALLEEADWDRVMNVNVKGAFLTTKAVLAGMIRRRAGAILNIGSVVGVRMLESPIHYAASKAALKGLTESLAKEVARYGIRVNCLAPGLLEDGIGKQLSAHKLDDYLRHCALGRVGRFDELARFAAFLISHANSYMNGETVTMDGGL